MARPKRATTTVFGQAVASLNMSYEDVALELDITRQYAGDLARGIVCPSLPLTFSIREWALAKGVEVPLESWYEVVINLMQEKR